MISIARAHRATKGVDDNDMDLGLKGKVAMVAGASRGLGLAVARALAAEGAAVSMASRQDSAICAAARAVAQETRADVFGTVVDVTAPGDIERWMDATNRKFGGVDLLFTNSGGPPAGAAISFDDRAWEAATDLLLFSVIRMVRGAVPVMQARGGGAILVSTSSAVKEPIANLGLSTVLRASVSALAKTLATELAAHGIRVNQIIPGRVDTDRVRELDEINGRRQGISADDQKTRSLASIPMKRYGAPDEFGRAAAFLLSDAANYVTGATLQVDGGMIRSVL
jgi:3-oxoacyl-[acyl-carrier protein] reductase